MTKISLRAYIQEINQLIENKNIADAIEHCKHILKQFPKHLEIYRLLGQAYLESGDYEEASDMFLRVLSVTPDDFIAQVGLSMIMEEQGDVDSAIWHMERAYEVRNTQAIHEELHRLYLLRDGVAPAKPMITRGALIRINIRSGLYQQALQEIQRALSSDPSRIDLKILEARIHYMQTNIPKTIRTCESVLKKLPYSYQANSLMAEIHGEMPEAERYKSKLYELNPYTSFVTENNTIDSVPDNVLRIEKLNLEEAYQDDFQLDSSSIQFGDFGQVVDQNSENTPNTTKTDRMKTKPKASPPKSTDEDGIDLPEYLANEETTTFEDSTMLEAETDDGTEIPDWMKQAGWGAAEERSLEEQQNLIQNFDNTVEAEEAADLISEDIVESDIPDWLQNIAPATEFNENPPVIDKLPEETAPQEEENLEWLNDILTTSSESPSDENSDVDFETLAEEIQPAVSAEDDQPEFGEDIDKDLAWLQDITSPEENYKGETLMEDNIFNDDLFEEDHSDELEEQGSETLPEFSNLSQPSGISEPDDAPAEVSETEDEIPVEANEEEEDFDLDSALSWLEGLAAKQGADEEALATAPEERIVEKPDFLTTESSPESILDEPMLEQEATPLSETVPEYKPELEEIPDWLQEESPMDSDQFTSPEELPVSEELHTLPEDLFAEETIEDSESEIAPPPWLKAVAPPEKILEEDEILTTEDIESPADEVTSDHPETSGKRASDHPTMALDFIKDDEKAEKEADIDEWLKNLPDMDWDMDETSGEELPTPEAASLENSQTPVESLEEISEQPEFSDEKDTGFIDELFEAPTETESDASEPIEPGSPYVWENEFSTQQEAVTDEPIPDWISDIADEDQVETPQEEPIQEMPAEFQEVIPAEQDEESEADFSIEEMSDDEMPDWMLDTSEIEIEEPAQESESEIPEPEQIQEAQLTETDEFVSVEDIEAYSEISAVESDSPAMDETMDISTSELEQLSEEDKHIADESTDEISTSAPTVPMQEEVESTPIITEEPETEEPTQPDEVEEFIAEEVQEETEVLQEKVEEESLAPVETLLPVSEILSGAKEDLINGDFEEAHNALETLLAKKSNTDEIIEILKFDIEHYHPIHVDSWVLLGDAYLQKGDLEKALDAYTKAEDFIY